MNQELLHIIDGIARDRNIDREVVFLDLESAMVSAVRKAYGQAEDTTVNIDRQSGEISAAVDGQALSMRQLTRIAAQTAKQVMIQKLREAERGSICEQYLERRGQIVTGRTVRWEGGAMSVDLGRAEAYLPKSEQIPGETHMPDERIRAMVLDVREQNNQVKIILSRTHPDFIRRLFDLEVPEVAEGIIEIKAMAREAGYRTKVAVASLDPRVDPVGACVGVRGSRIKNIVDEVAGEKIDIVRWHESSKVLIAYSLKPAEVADVALCFELGRATVVVNEDQLSLAIGKRGQNVRLAARLTTWDIDILTPTEFNTGLDTLEKAFKEVEGVDSQLIDQVVALGMVSVLDVEEAGADPLASELGVDRLVAQRVVARCAQEARRVAERQAQRAASQRAKAEVSKAEQEDKPPSDSTESTGEEPVAEQAAVSDPPGEQPVADGPEIEEQERPSAGEQPVADGPEIEEQERPSAGEQPVADGPEIEEQERPSAGEQPVVDGPEIEEQERPSAGEQPSE